MRRIAALVLAVAPVLVLAGDFVSNPANTVFPDKKQGAICPFFSKDPSKCWTHGDANAIKGSLLDLRSALGLIQAGAPSGVAPEAIAITADGTTTARTLASWLSDRPAGKSFGTHPIEEIGCNLAGTAWIGTLGIYPCTNFDSTAAIQALIDRGAGTDYLTVGTYLVTSPLLLRDNVRLFGEGSGNYDRGPSVARITVIKPTVGFVGSSVVKLDAANMGPSAAYIRGAVIGDLTIDMYNIRSTHTVALELSSVSNTDTFPNVRIINHDVGTYVYVGMSTNVGALQSDGISFNNLYTLSNNVTPLGATPDPSVVVEDSNEIAFLHSKIQRSAITPGSIGAHVRSTARSTVNRVLFDTVSFTGATDGVVIEGVTGSAQGPRWVAVRDGTFEGVKNGTRLKGVAAAPAQFNSVSGSRMQTVEAGARAVILDAYAYGNTIVQDEFSGYVYGATTWSSGTTYAAGAVVRDGGTGAIWTSLQAGNTNHALAAGAWWSLSSPMLVEAKAGSLGNWIQASPAGVIDDGTNNVVFGRGPGGEFQVGNGINSAPKIVINAGAGATNPSLIFQRAGAGKAAFYLSDAFGDSDLLLYMATGYLRFTKEGNIIGNAMQATSVTTPKFSPTPVAEASVAPGVVYVDSADGKLYFKDAGGTPRALY